MKNIKRKLIISWVFALALTLIASAAPVVAAPINLIANPSVEQVDANGQPVGWHQSKTGTNDATFSYVNNGNIGAHSLLVSINNLSNGDAKWFFDSVPVAPGAAYEFRDYFKSTVPTAILAEYQMGGGSYTYKWFGDVGPSASWTLARFVFTVPDNVSKMTILHLINAPGTLQTDDFSLTQYTPATFNSSVVSVTFDDGYRSVYNQASSIMDQLGIKPTLYIITGDIGKKSYMTKTMLSTLKAQGYEIGSHTVTHPYLTRVSAKRLQSELVNSQDVLAAYFGGPINDFASPYGDYNAAVLNAIRPLYRSHRTIEAGLNTKGGFDQYRIKSYMIEYNTPVATVESLIDQAKQDNAWLVLVYHEVDKSSTWTYNRRPSDLENEMTYLKNSGVAVKTVDQALDSLLPQIY